MNSFRYPIGKNKIVYCTTVPNMPPRFTIFGNSTLVATYTLNLRLNENFIIEGVLNRYPNTINIKDKIFEPNKYLVSEIIEYIKEQEGDDE